MATSDHSQFQFAAERYVLGELSEQEVLEFENHFFSCAGCAQDVEDLTVIRTAAPVVLPQLRATSSQNPAKSAWAWLKFGWVPQVALAGLAALALLSGYQNAVEIPHLKTAANEGELQIAPVPRALTASRAAASLTLSTKDRAVPLVISNEWPENYGRYQARIRQRGNEQPLMNAESPIAKGSVFVSVPASRLGVGEFELTILGIREGGTPQVVARYPFTIQEKSAE